MGIRHVPVNPSSKVAGGIDHFAKGIDRLKDKMWDVPEARSLVYTCGERIGSDRHGPPKKGGDFFLGGP